MSVGRKGRGGRDKTTAEVLKTSSKFILKYDLTIGNDHDGAEKVLFDLH